MAVVRAIPAVLLACLIGSALSCSVTVRTWTTSATCSGVATDSKSIVANNTCLHNGGEFIKANVRGDLLVTTTYESAGCPASEMSSEPAKLVRNKCTDVGGGMSVQASWGPECEMNVAPASSNAVQIEPCYWSDFYRLPKQSFQEFVCHNVSDDTVVVFDTSSENGVEPDSVAVFSDADYRAWSTGAKAFCVNGDCAKADAMPKSGSYNVDAAGSPYHVVLMNTDTQADTANFDVTISASVGNSMPVVGGGITGNPSPPPPPPPPHPSPPPPHPSPPPPPPPPHPPGPPPPHPSPPPPDTCGSLNKATSTFCVENSACNGFSCPYIPLYGENFTVSWDYDFQLTPVAFTIHAGGTSKTVNAGPPVSVAFPLTVSIPKIGVAYLNFNVNLTAASTRESYEINLTYDAVTSAGAHHPEHPYHLTGGRFDFRYITPP